MVGCFWKVVNRGGKSVVGTGCTASRERKRDRRKTERSKKKLASLAKLTHDRSRQSKAASYGYSGSFTIATQWKRNWLYYVVASLDSLLTEIAL